MRAIVYTSNTGSTEKYAKMLSHQICVPSYSMVLVQGAKDIGDVKNTDGLDRAYKLGLSIG